MDKADTLIKLKKLFHLIYWSNSYL